MATRNTLKEAQDQKAQLEQDFPGIVIEIEDRSGERQVGRGVAERDGLEIVQDDGSVFVTVKVTRFSILEIRKCGVCGSKYTTRAIGECGLRECRNCKNARLEQHSRELDESIERESVRLEEATWRDAWEQS